jgi:hypothetical protein
VGKGFFFSPHETYIHIVKDIGKIKPNKCDGTLQPDCEKVTRTNLQIAFGRLEPDRSKGLPRLGKNIMKSS